MSVTVNMTMFNKVANLIVDLKANHKINIPMFVWGKHGVGKSEGVRTLAKSINYNCVVLNLANIPVEDLLGSPDMKGGYYLPDWFSKQDGRPTIYFLDELPRAPKYVLQGMFNFILEGRLHNHFIKDNDVVIAAGNPDTNEYDQNVFEDTAFMSRFGHFYLEPNDDEYVKYLTDNKAHPALIRTVKQFSNKIDVSVPSDSKIRCTPDRRALYNIGKLLNVVDKEVIKDVGFNIMSSMVGADYAQLIYQNWVDETSIPDIPTLIKSIKDNKFNFKPDEFDKFKVINMNLAKWVSERPFIKKTNKFDISNEDLKAIKFYIDFLPKDYQVSLIHEFKMVFEKENMGKMTTHFFMQIDVDFLSKLLEL